MGKKLGDFGVKFHKINNILDMRNRECERAYEQKVPLILDSNYIAQWSNMELWLDIIRGKLRNLEDKKLDDLNLTKRNQLISLLSGVTLDMKYFISSELHIKMFIKSLQDFFLLPDSLLSEVIVSM